VAAQLRYVYSKQLKKKREDAAFSGLFTAQKTTKILPACLRQWVLSRLRHTILNGLGARMVIAAGVAAVGTIAGAVVSSGASNHAANVAQDAANKNNAIQAQTRAENTANLQPFMERGNAAGENYNALLGLGGDPAAAQKAFATYQGSDGYQFRVNQGLNALNVGFAAKGALNSGAAMKEIDTYGQGAASDEFGKYLGYLGNQQNIGLSGANALAGVNTNYANQVSSNNNNAALTIR
jgi:hypothetical protein